MLGSSRLSAKMLANSSNIPTKSEIMEKWDKMDELLEIMFMLACKWKHGKDVHGITAEKARSGNLHYREVHAFKEQLRAKNVQQLTAACGTIVARGKGTCRQSCADRWKEATGKRAACDDKCVSAYAAFERSCAAKAQNLEKVYAVRVKMADAREQCYRAWCDEFPSVWMKADAAAMTVEVEAQCARRCTPDQIEKRCERKWQLEVDFLRPTFELSCHGNSTVTQCFDVKKSQESTAYDTCILTDSATCETQLSDCKTKSLTGQTHRQAEEFCQERKKMCSEQVTSHCLSAHEAALKKHKVQCEEEGANGMEICVHEALSAKELEVVDGCKSTLPTKCAHECHGKCETQKMNQCLLRLASDHDPAEVFCQDFWDLLHKSSEVDPMTGDPIVLLSQRRD